MAETNPWDDVLGPFYAETGLVKHGMVVADDLIGLSTIDGVTVYPHAQFDVLQDGTLHRREKVLELWNQLIRPAIDEGVVDEWTATGLLLQSTTEHPSEAEVISHDDSQVDRVAQQIARSINRFRQ